MTNMKDKVALVAGGSSGIGRATAQAFAQAGAKVVVAARRVEIGEQTVAEIVHGGSDATFVQADGLCCKEFWGRVTFAASS